MKSIYLTVSVVMASLFFSGCGDDRSHGTYDRYTAKSIDKKVWITETNRGKEMLKNNFIYIPGGFDVDDDGANEGGFWLAQYEAKADSNVSKRYVNVNSVTNIQDLIKRNFQIYDAQGKYKKFNKSLTQNSSYTTRSASEIEGLKATHVEFTKDGLLLSGVSPIEAVISLQNSQIEGGYSISLPSEKQWMQIVKLVINNPKNWTGKEVGKGKLFQGKRYSSSDRNSFFIANSILGEDENVPKTYEAQAYDLSGGLAEWTSGMVAIKDRFLTGSAGISEFEDVNNIPKWWKPILKDKVISLGSIEGAGMYHDGTAQAGANDTLIVRKDGTSGDVDDYAVVARGGSNSIDDKNLVGISAAKLNYGPGYQGPTVGFRAASGYVY